MGNRMQQDNCKPLDLLIVGGGINGCGIARDAAGRGISVLLAERGDLGSGTSSASTKLIHGGLRYLEQFRFGLVRESLLEREVLWRAAPHIIRPMRFVVPVRDGARPASIIRAGLWIYDHLGGRVQLPASRAVNLKNEAVGRPLKPHLRRGFAYSDCWVDDARLVVLNAMDAAAKGATICVRAEVVSAAPEGSIWRANLRNRSNGKTTTVAARCLVNAAGPWAPDVIQRCGRHHPPAPVRLLKGSHIVVRSLFEHDCAYLFQHGDGRVIFAIPFESDFTLIGTTDMDHEGAPESASIQRDEITYLCRAVSRFLENEVRPNDVVWSYCGVRPIHDLKEVPASEASRGYTLERVGPPGRAVLLNVFGGKITTYRSLAEAALDKLSDLFPRAGKPWTRHEPLPGGAFPVEGVPKLVAELQKDYKEIEDALAFRLVRAYGTHAREVAAAIFSSTNPGECFGADLSAHEVAYLMKKEWARTAEDVLWRRSKLGLRVSPEAAERLDHWMKERAVE